MLIMPTPACEVKEPNEGCAVSDFTPVTPPPSIDQELMAKDRMYNLSAALHDALLSVELLEMVNQSEVTPASIGDGDIDPPCDVDEPSEDSEAAMYAAAYRRGAPWVYPTQPRKAALTNGISTVIASGLVKAWSIMTVSTAGDWPKLQFTTPANAPSVNNFVTYQGGAGLTRQWPKRDGTHSPSSIRSPSLLTPVDSPNWLNVLLPQIGSFLSSKEAKTVDIFEDFNLRGSRGVATG